MSGFGSIIGSYALSVSDELPPDDHGNIALVATSLEINSPIAGELGFPGDVDWFSFSATAGTEYTIRTSLGTLFDSDLTLYDRDSTTVIAVSYANSFSEALLFWQAPATGVYYIEPRLFTDVLCVRHCGG